MPVIASVIDAQIGGDPIQPGAETSLGTVGLARAIHPEKNLLSKLFSDRLVMDHAIHEVNDRFTVLLDEEVETGHITGSQLQHDRGIVHLPEITSHVMVLGGLEIFEEPRVDRQRSHIIHNPIFAIGLRFLIRILQESHRCAQKGRVHTVRWRSEFGRGVDILLDRLYRHERSDFEVEASTPWIAWIWSKY